MITLFMKLHFLERVCILLLFLFFFFWWPAIWSRFLHLQRIGPSWSKRYVFVSVHWWINWQKIQIFTKYFHLLQFHSQLTNTAGPQHAEMLNLTLRFSVIGHSPQSRSHQYSEVSMWEGTSMWKICGGVSGALLTPESPSALIWLISPASGLAIGVCSESGAGGSGASALGLMFWKRCRCTTSLPSVVQGSSTEMSLRNLELMPKYMRGL